jgi:hypothetical protein
MKDLVGKTLKLEEELTLVSIEDSGALLDIEKRCYHDLNSTAFFIAGLLENGYPYDEIPAALASKFNVDIITARRDTDSFIEEMLRHELLNIGEETIKFSKASEFKHGIETYQSPAIEYNSELSVACAPLDSR